MPVSRNSGRSPSSKARRSGNLPCLAESLIVWLALAAASAAAVAFFYQRGELILYGDAEAHLNIARRIVDSRTPGYEQIGTVWLPLPHLLMLPLVRSDQLWRNGLAGAVPAACGFVLAGAFFYAGLRRTFLSRAPALAALGILALNPNLLYMQSTAMTEAIWLATLAALFYCTLRIRQGPSWVWALGAGMASLAGTLTRYEGWFLIPFVGFYLLLAGGKQRGTLVMLYLAVASMGPLYWLGHNWWLHGNPLEFYNGPYSARGIYERSLAAGMARYPGDHDWARAGVQLREAIRLCAGWPAALLGLAGTAAALLTRRLWPVALLALPPLFYWISIYSAGTPIFVPHRWPHSFYNTRYGLSGLPLAAFGAGALAAVMPRRIQAPVAAAILLAGLSWWIAQPRPEAWICWRESVVNSEARRAWTLEAAQFLRTARRPGEAVAASFGDLTGILRAAGIPLRHLLHEGNGPEWLAAMARPDLFLRQPWAVVISGDTVATALVRMGRRGPRYDLLKTVTVGGGPVIQLWRRAAPFPPELTAGKAGWTP